MTELKETVRSRYARHATELPVADEPPTLGLGDAVALARPRPGESVLDLGSGPGRDLLAAARAVGSSGRAIGVDFTPEMIDRARQAASEAGLDNVTILQGDLEELPLPSGDVDAVISNCVINLTGDKARVLSEAFRVLRPGGRLAVLDTAFETEPPPEVRQDTDAWCSCVGGALTVDDYRTLLAETGFENIELRVVETSCGEDCSPQASPTRAVEVVARKPAGASVRNPVNACDCC